MKQNPTTRAHVFNGRDTGGFLAAYDYVCCKAVKTFCSLPLPSHVQVELPINYFQMIDIQSTIVLYANIQPGNYNPHTFIAVTTPMIQTQRAALRCTLHIPQTVPLHAISRYFQVPHELALPVLHVLRRFWRRWTSTPSWRVATWRTALIL